MTETECDWLASAVAGDRDALGRLLERYGPAVAANLQIGARWRGSLDAGDVMQVSYIEAFLHISSFDVENAAAFPAWLTRIAKNNLRDGIRALEARGNRAEQRVEATPSDDSCIGLLDLLVGSVSTPSTSMRNREACEQLHAALDQLPDDYASAVRLFDLEGRPIDEVAAALGRSTGAAYMLRQRAHDRLRTLLGPGSQFMQSRA